MEREARARRRHRARPALQAQPDAGEQPVGGVYLKERCTKTAEGRALVVERKLFREAGRDEKNFVDETRVTILRTHVQGRVGLN
jgi:hypothetical protein